MDFLIEPAFAEGGAAAGGGQMQFLITIVLFTVVFYFIIIRPQSKRQKEQRQMLAGLAKGDEVVTTGGLLGRITKLNDNFVTLDLGGGVEVTVQRQAIGQVMPKGTIKSL